MDVIIVSIGDELILGQTVDTNAAWLSRELAALGANILEHITLGDDIDALVDTLDRAAQQVDIIIATGGLGPTDDDLTRHALARVLGTELVLNQEVLAQMQTFFSRICRPMVQRNHIQAMIPNGAEILENTCGTACGLAVQIDRAWAFFTPGVPKEMHEMFSRAIAPRIKNLQTGKPSEVLLTRTIHTFGTGESNVAEMLGDVMTRGRNPLVNCTVANGIISLRINARAETPQQAAAMFKPVEAEIHQRLGNLVFGYDQETLASVVGQRLREKKATLAVAESCTGGGLAKALTDIPGSSDYFLGGLLTYSNEVKINLLHVDRAALIEHGAVSEIVARQMAEQTRRLIGSDYALSITGIAGPGGGTAEKPVGLVFMGLADRQETFVARHIFTGDRATIRQRCVNMTLNLMRLKLIS